MRRIIIALLLSGMLAGCGETIYLRNMTGATVACGPYLLDAVGSNSEAMREAQCIQDYQRQGYERAPGP